MIALSEQAAVGLLGVAALVAAGSGAALGVGSLSRGPDWVLRLTARLAPAAAAGALAAIAAVVLVRPPWLGIGFLYLVAVLYLWGMLLRRRLIRVRDTVGFGEVAGQDRSELIAGLRRKALWSAGAVAALAAVALPYSVLAAGFGLGLALILAAMGAFLRA
ncbi:MAG: hypothetical protein KatS3mg011_0149 [Acidimicrobiia bacterium]|nr:MAG: hypothetical protein KatS3mg011_0149 [Acidimicrobiia bacterium]